MKASEQIIEVENIKCGGCATTIAKALQKLDGMEKVTVDIENEIVRFSGNSDKNKVSQKLAELGYPEKGNNTLILKAKSMVSCATGKFGKS